MKAERSHSARQIEDPVSHEGDRSLGNEWALLELLARGLTTPERRQAFGRLIADDLQWGELLDQPLRHRMLSLVAESLVSAGLLDLVPRRLAEHLRPVLALSRYPRRRRYTQVQ